MVSLLTAYASALIIFAAVDIAWIMAVAEPMFRAALGQSLVAEVRLAPAILFYLMYPAGLVMFAVAPALRSESVGHALAAGAMLGAFAYGTYDLTNFATLRDWTLSITVLDIAYGAVVTALVSTASFVVARTVVK